VHHGDTSAWIIYVIYIYLVLRKDVQVMMDSTMGPRGREQFSRCVPCACVQLRRCSPKKSTETKTEKILSNNCALHGHVLLPLPKNLRPTVPVVAGCAKRSPQLLCTS
jgi:hypothetical protein